MTSLRRGTEDKEKAMLQAFPFSLLDQADSWMYYLPYVSITTWHDMKKLFLDKYFPASKATSIRKEIGGLIPEQRCLIDAASGGALSEKTLSQATGLIESMASKAQPCYTRNDSNIRKVNEIGGSSQTEERLNSMEKMMHRITSTVIPKYEEHMVEVNVVFPNQRQSLEEMMKVMMQEQKEISKNFQQNLQYQHNTDSAIKDLQIQMGQMATDMNSMEAQLFLKLTSQSFVNPKEQVNVVLLRSGKQLEPNQQNRVSDDLDQTSHLGSVPEPITDSNLDRKKRCKQNLRKNHFQVSTDQPKVSVPTHVTPPHFPSRSSKSKKQAQDKEIMEIFSKLQINIPFIEAIRTVPRRAKFLKDLCTKNDRLIVNEVAQVHESASAMLLKKMSAKCKDPGGFTVPITFGNKRRHG
ncbi:uncharacterized protein LOC113359154 [Papaver somniferum]|uniref:uncharacterized protein LOC113359154 n=1 Tax=Papaver somniferum TaxID=3469 RepID=UPI000E7038BA|nr:uncharacterized protein LOC113359154 [Papaver somniferum]